MCKGVLENVANDQIQSIRLMKVLNHCLLELFTCLQSLKVCATVIAIQRFKSLNMTE